MALSCRLRDFWVDLLEDFTMEKKENLNLIKTNKTIFTFQFSLDEYVRFYNTVLPCILFHSIKKVMNWESLG